MPSIAVWYPSIYFPIQQNIPGTATCMRARFAARLGWRNKVLAVLNLLARLGFGAKSHHATSRWGSVSALRLCQQWHGFPREKPVHIKFICDHSDGTYRSQSLLVIHHHADREEIRPKLRQDARGNLRQERPGAKGFDSSGWHLHRPHGVGT